jgi:hypothetical protein
MISVLELLASAQKLQFYEWFLDMLHIDDATLFLLMKLGFVTHYTGCFRS